MPTVIYIRHADDRGEDEYRHDRRLNARGRKKAPKAAGRLIELIGHPDVAYVSPYRRTIETLDAMSTRFARPVLVRRDPRIAQCLSERQQRDPKISPETAVQVPIAEDRDSLKRRVTAHVEEVRRRAEPVIWCVTHQAVIDLVADLLGVRHEGDLDFLDHLVAVT